jgi:hypothetical protein
MKGDFYSEEQTMVWQYSEKKPIENLPELLENYHKYGGKIIKYEKVVSVIFVLMSEPSFEWVPEGKNRTIAGWRYTLGTFLLGWWSLTGIFRTLTALTVNLSGGTDMTKEFPAICPPHNHKLL